MLYDLKILTNFLERLWESTREESNMKIPLTIDVNYMPDWGVSEGIRELVQNWLDASDDIGFEGSMSYKNGTLKLVNPRANLERDSLLLGVTTKIGRQDQRGQFGEGLKLGTLALCREGRSVKVYTQNENWQAKIEESEDFIGRRVLTFRCRRRPTPSNDVTVEVSPITPEEYLDIRNKFLKFKKPCKDKMHECYYGTLLLEEKFSGEVFIKGIKIADDSDLKYGYNLKHANLDRDRKMVDQWDLTYGIAKILSSATMADFISSEDILNLFHAGLKDVSAYSHMTTEVRTHIAEAWTSNYEEGVIPVASVEEAEMIGHFGIRGIPVAPDLLKAFDGIIESVSEAKARVCKAPTKVWKLEDLEDEYQDNLLWSCGEIESVMKDLDILKSLSVVDFHQKELSGLYLGGPIQIAAHVLADRIMTLSVLIHEVCHRYGGDGSKEHVSSMEELWTSIARTWMPAA